MSIILVLLNGMLFPEFMNFMYLTYTPQIFQHWKLVLFLIIMGYFLGVLLLIGTKQSRLPLNEAESFILKQIKKEKRNKKWYLDWLDRLPNSIRWIISVFFVIPFFVALGIGSTTIFKLCTTFIFRCYSVIFIIIFVIYQLQTHRK